MRSAVNDVPKSRRRGHRPEHPYRKLKPGPGLPAIEVRADQRARLHGAIIDLVAKQGFDRVTVRGVSDLAGVSTRTFYGQFASTEECLASTVDGVGSALLSRAAQVRLSPRSGGEVGEVIQSLMADFALRPMATELLLVGVFDAGPLARGEGQVFTEGLELLLVERLTASSGFAVPRQLVAGMVAGITRVVTTTSLAGRADELPALAGMLTAWILALNRVEACHLQAFAIGSSPEGPWNGALLAGVMEQGEVGPRDLSQREYDRLLATVVSLGVTKGFASLTVPTIRREAGVSRRSFDRWFADASGCFLAGIEALAHSAAIQAAHCSTHKGAVHRSLIQTVLTLCTQAAENAELTQLVFSEMHAAASAGVLCREQMITAAAVRLQISDVRLGAVEGEASVAAAWCITKAEIVAGRVHHLAKLAPLLAYVLEPTGESELPVIPKDRPRFP